MAAYCDAGVTFVYSRAARGKRCGLPLEAGAIVPNFNCARCAAGVLNPLPLEGF
jgi:hypothetical protein